MRAVEEDKIKQAASMPSVPPRTVLGDISKVMENQALPGMIGFMRRSQNLKKAIQRERSLQHGYPPKPKTYEDLANIPEHLTKTSDDLPFLLLNDTVIKGDPLPSGSRLLVFMSSRGREVLAGCDSWFVDGTFKAAAQTLFHQILFVVGLTGMGKAVPCLFALLPNKGTSTYIRLADCLKEELSKSPKPINVSMIMMDFEKGLNRAFHEIFPQASVQGCNFHWKNCLLKKLRASWSSTTGMPTSTCSRACERLRLGDHGQV